MPEVAWFHGDEAPVIFSGRQLKGVFGFWGPVHAMSGPRSGTGPAGNVLCRPSFSMADYSMLLEGRATATPKASPPVSGPASVTSPPAAPGPSSGLTSSK